jgi:hypothetical protein
VLLYSLNETTIDFSQAKGGIALIEVFFGSAFALFVDSLFSKPHPAPQAGADDTGKLGLGGGDSGLADPVG